LPSTGRSVGLSAEQNRALIRDAKLAMPVLAVSADGRATPDMAAPLRPFTDDLRGDTIARSGHFIPEEQPEVLARLSGDFFEEQ
jgi:pimeloyl-ACP methyl ester carboxylesterase